MTKELNDLEVSVPCTRCGHSTITSIGWLKFNDLLMCDRCGSPIDLDAVDFRQSLKDVERTIASFNKASKS